MARVTNGIVTFNDLQYMVDNLNYVQRNPIPSSHKCCNTVDIESHIYAFVNDFGYTSNRRIPYQLIKPEIYLSSIAWLPNYTAQYFDFNIIYTGNWTITDNQSWISVSVTSGTDNYTANRISILQNNSTSSRVGVMTITDASTGATNTLTVTQGGFPPIATDSISLGYHVSYYPTACGASKTTYYIPAGQSWGAATALYTNSIGNSNAVAGWYAADLAFPANDLCRYWNGTNFTTSEDC